MHLEGLHERGTMCGLAGEFGVGVGSLDFVLRCNSNLEHRGPDGSGVWSHRVGEFGVVLGHRRLSIQDLSSAGSQPMTSPDGRLAVSYNGEIYNFLELRDELQGMGHKFVGESDTEVLLHSWLQWGPGCLSRLDGMFAFALFDSLSSELFLVRDAFGVKPLYYEMTDSVVRFASIPSVLTPAPEGEEPFDSEAMFKYLFFGQYDLGSSTFFKGVHRVSPGSYLKIKAATGAVAIEECTWWNPPSKTQSISFDDAASRVRQLFLQSVARQMRSDVPIGFALSGGVDSTAIICAARTVSPNSNLVAFGYIADDPQVSEEKWIRIASDRSMADLRTVSFGVNDLSEQIDAMAEAQGEPFSSSRIFAQYKVFEEAKLAGVKVLLEGQGGDEVFAGYHGFAHLRIISLLETGKFGAAFQFLVRWRGWPGRSVIQLLLQSGLYLLKAKNLPLPLQILARRIAFLEDCRPLMRSKLFGYGRKNKLKPYAHDLNPAFKGRRVIEGLIDALQSSYIPQLVRQGDRNAMAHSVENRVPFLSLPLVEFVLTLPEEYLISSTGQTKSVFKAAMSGIVPDEILARRDKVGFETPQDALWRSSRLSDSTTDAGQWFDAMLEHVNPESLGASPALKWRYLNLALWLSKSRPS